MKAPPAIALECHPSRLLAAATVTVALLASWAVAISGAAVWLRTALMAWAMLAGAASLVRLLRPRVRSLRWRADGTLELRMRDRWSEPAKDVAGTLQGARVIGPLIVLVLRWPPRGRATLWLLPDNLDGDTRRRLRMRLGRGYAGTALSGNADSG